VDKLGFSDSSNIASTLDLFAAAGTFGGSGTFDETKIRALKRDIVEGSADAGSELEAPAESAMPLAGATTLEFKSARGSDALPSDTLDRPHANAGGYQSPLDQLPAGSLLAYNGGTASRAPEDDPGFETLNQAGRGKASPSDAERGALLDQARKVGGGDLTKGFQKLIADGKLDGGGLEQILEGSHDPEAARSAKLAVAGAKANGTLPKSFISQYAHSLTSLSGFTQDGHAPAAALLSAAWSPDSKISGASTQISQEAIAQTMDASSHSMSPQLASALADAIATGTPTQGTQAGLLLRAKPSTVEAMTRGALQWQAASPQSTGGTELLAAVADNPTAKNASSAVWKGAADALTDGRTALDIANRTTQSDPRADLLRIYQNAAPGIRADVASGDPVAAQRYQAFLRFGENGHATPTSQAYDGQMRSDRSALGAKATFPPMTAADALGKVQGDRSKDMVYDGNSQFVIKPDADATTKQPEFGKNTTVVFVNGINTDMRRSIVGAQRFADETGNNVQVIHNGTDGLNNDIATVTAQWTGRSPDLSPADQAVRDQILSRVKSDGHGGLTMTGDVHFMAHSKGALSVERGLEAAKQRLMEEHHSESDVTQMFAQHVSVETFGGASLGMPQGVKTVAYWDNKDQVPALAGSAPVDRNEAMDYTHFSLNLRANADYNAAAIDDVKNTFNHGSRIQVPANDRTRLVNFSGGLSGLVSAMEDDAFNDNHDLPHYMPYRQKFADAYKHADSSISADYSVPNSIAPKAYDFPSVKALQDRLDEVAERTSAWLPPVRSIESYQGGQVHGQIAILNQNTVALNAGNGNYEIIDVSHASDAVKQKLVDGANVIVKNGVVTLPPQSKVSQPLSSGVER
jgi:hypothetical protein